jgi:hypothetical protein
MGVIYFIPIKKELCVIKRPNIDAANIFGRSALSTLSLGISRESNQNIIDAPNALIEKIPNGDIRFELVKSLHTIIFTPNIT